MRKIVLNATTLSTLVAFIATQVFLPTPAAMAASEVAPTSFQISAQAEFTVPADLGTVETFNAGNGPTVIHIQTAHGNYDSQKKIQALLHYLKQNYDIKTLFVEGSAFKLRPELFRLFPDDMELTMAIADELTKEALVKGAELFLLEDPEAEAYGIEQADIYQENGKAFKSVLRKQGETENFIREMDKQMVRLTSPYLSKDLRSFVDRLDDYESKKIRFLDWLDYLAGKANEAIEVNLKDPAYQIRFPYLTRIFAIQKLEEELDGTKLKKERAAFLSSVKRFLPDAIYESVKELLESPVRRHSLPAPETGELFQAMVAKTPQGFSFDRYPNVKAFMARLILQSEIKASALMEEMEELTDQISQNLAKTDKEISILSLLKDHRLLRKLFNLELTPREYEKVVERGSKIQPQKMIDRLFELNDRGRVRNMEFRHIEEIASLYTVALEFYRLVKKRDEVMTRNVVAQMKKLNIDKAAVITGGFHSDPFTDFFSKKDYRYALVSPKISTPHGREAYVESLLQNKKDSFF